MYGIEFDDFDVAGIKHHGKILYFMRKVSTKGLILYDAANHTFFPSSWVLEFITWYVSGLLTTCRRAPIRWHHIRWRESTSVPCRLLTGVPQGSLLDLPLFFLYACSLGEVLTMVFISLSCWWHSTHYLLFSFQHSCYCMDFNMFGRHLMMHGSSSAKVCCCSSQALCPLVKFL